MSAYSGNEDQPFKLPDWNNLNQIIDLDISLKKNGSEMCCLLCGFCVRNNADIYKHIKMAQHELFVKCSKCGMVFKSKNDVMEHLTHVHNLSTVDCHAWEILPKHMLFKVVKKDHSFKNRDPEKSRSSYFFPENPSLNISNRHETFFENRDDIQTDRELRRGSCGYTTTPTNQFSEEFDESTSVRQPNQIDEPQLGSETTLHKNLFSCQICSAGMKTLDSLDEHMRVMHTDLKVVCSLCSNSQLFTSIGGMYYEHHLQSHKDQVLKYTAYCAVSATKNNQSGMFEDAGRNERKRRRWDCLSPNAGYDNGSSSDGEESLSHPVKRQRKSPFRYGLASHLFSDCDSGVENSSLISEDTSSIVSFQAACTSTPVNKFQDGGSLPLISPLNRQNECSVSNRNSSIELPTLKSTKHTDDSRSDEAQSSSMSYEDDLTNTVRLNLSQRAKMNTNTRERSGHDHRSNNEKNGEKNTSSGSLNESALNKSNQSSSDDTCHDKNSAESLLSNQSDSKLNAHNQSDGKLAYHCPFGDEKILYSRKGFLFHVGGHFDYRPHRCGICDKTLRDCSGVAKHFKNRHPNEKKTSLFNPEPDIVCFLKIAEMFGVGSVSTPTMRWRCLRCDFKCHMIEMIKRHMSVHTREIGDSKDQQYEEISENTTNVIKQDPSPQKYSNVQQKSSKSAKSESSFKSHWALEMRSHKIVKKLDSQTNTYHFQCRLCLKKSRSCLEAKRHFMDKHASCGESEMIKGHMSVHTREIGDSKDQQYEETSEHTTNVIKQDPSPQKYSNVQQKSSKSAKSESSFKSHWALEMRSHKIVKKLDSQTNTYHFQCRLCLKKSRSCLEAKRHFMDKHASCGESEMIEKHTSTHGIGDNEDNQEITENITNIIKQDPSPRKLTGPKPSDMKNHKIVRKFNSLTNTYSFKCLLCPKVSQKLFDAKKHFTEKHASCGKSKTTGELKKKRIQTIGIVEVMKNHKFVKKFEKTTLSYFHNCLLCPERNRTFSEAKQHFKEKHDTHRASEMIGSSSNEESEKITDDATNKDLSSKEVGDSKPVSMSINKMKKKSKLPMGKRKKVLDKHKCVKMLNKNTLTFYYKCTLCSKKTSHSYEAKQHFIEKHKIQEGSEEIENSSNEQSEDNKFTHSSTRAVSEEDPFPRTSGDCISVSASRENLKLKFFFQLGTRKDVMDSHKFIKKFDKNTLSYYYKCTICLKKMPNSSEAKQHFMDDHFTQEGSESKPIAEKDDGESIDEQHEENMDPSKEASEQDSSPKEDSDKSIGRPCTLEISGLNAELQDNPGEGKRNELQNYHIERRFSKMRGVYFYKCKLCPGGKSAYLAASKRHFIEKHTNSKREIADKPSGMANNDSITGLPEVKKENMHGETDPLCNPEDQQNLNVSNTIKTEYSAQSEVPTQAHGNEENNDIPEKDCHTVSKRKPKKPINTKSVKNFLQKASKILNGRVYIVRNSNIQPQLAPFKMEKLYDTIAHYNFFTCTVCPHRTKHFDVAKRHFKNNHASGSVSPQIPDVPEEKPKLKRKLIKMSADDSYLCALCRRSWTSIILLQKHVDDCHPNMAARCYLCNEEKLTVRVLYTSHFRPTHPSSSFRYYFAKISSDETSEDKMQFPSGQNPVITCKLCKRVYSKKNMSRFEEHLAKHHIFYYPFKCPMCPMKNYHKGDVQAHLRRTHKNETINVTPDVNQKKQDMIDRLMEEHVKTLLRTRGSRTSSPASRNSKKSDLKLEAPSSADANGINPDLETSVENSGSKTDPEIKEHDDFSLECPCCPFANSNVNVIRQHIKESHPDEYSSASNDPLEHRKSGQNGSSYEKSFNWAVKQEPLDPDSTNYHCEPCNFDAPDLSTFEEHLASHGTDKSNWNTRDDDNAVCNINIKEEPISDDMYCIRDNTCSEIFDKSEQITNIDSHVYEGFNDNDIDAGTSSRDSVTEPTPCMLFEHSILPERNPHDNDELRELSTIQWKFSQDNEDIFCTVFYDDPKVLEENLAEFMFVGDGIEHDYFLNPIKGIRGFHEDESYDAVKQIRMQARLSDLSADIGEDAIEANKMKEHFAEIAQYIDV